MLVATLSWQLELNAGIGRKFWLGEREKVQVIVLGTEDRVNTALATSPTPELFSGCSKASLRKKRLAPGKRLALSTCHSSDSVRNDGY